MTSPSYVDKVACQRFEWIVLRRSLKTGSLFWRLNLSEDQFKELEENLSATKQRLMDHPIFRQNLSIANVQKIMRVHVFAVWDFMLIVKALQRSLTCVDPVWIPRQNGKVVRLINEIVLTEESDDILEGHPMSHLEMYLNAMREIGADTEVIETFLGCLKRGVSVEDALSREAVPMAAAAHIRNTMRVVELAPHVVASVFFFSRESLIPSMFRRFVANLTVDEKSKAKTFNLYLERHLDVDEHEHAPMAQTMLMELCMDSGIRWNEAESEAKKAMELRYQLWIKRWL